MEVGGWRLVGGGLWVEVGRWRSGRIRRRERLEEFRR